MDKHTQFVALDINLFSALSVFDHFVRLAILVKSVSQVVHMFL